ncbi:MAG: type II toxin-antitoxin system HicB family antitoxin [Thermodesulfobacteriota bacterium]
MKFKVIVHPAEEGGYWAEVPALPGCVTEGDTWEELMANLREAITGWLSVEEPTAETTTRDRIIEVAL